MELADKCETRSQTVQNEQFASEHASPSSIKVLAEYLTMTSN